MDEDANKVNRNKDDDVRCDLLPLGQELQIRVHDYNANDGVEAWEKNAIGDRNPGSESC